MLAFILRVLFASLLIYTGNSYATHNTNWHCNLLQTKNLYQHQIIWKTLTCSGSHKKNQLKNLNINLIYASLKNPNIKFIPRRATTPNQLAKLPEIANQLSSEYEVIAGINGGYFFRSDLNDFKDNICTGKIIHPPKAGESMGDSLLQFNNKAEATNCAFIPGLATRARAALILSGVNPKTNKPAPYITYVKPNIIYKHPDGSIPDAIGAGPNLITNGKLAVNSPDENLISTLEFAANSAVGVINDENKNPDQLVLFTVDGSGNSRDKHLPAMNAAQMADFMLNYLKVDDAISMDQGGSTTMYVGMADAKIFPLRVVSNSNYDPNTPRSAEQVRNIYDGLFIALPKKN